MKMNGSKIAPQDAWCTYYALPRAVCVWLLGTPAQLAPSEEDVSLSSIVPWMPYEPPWIRNLSYHLSHHRVPEHQMLNKYIALFNILQNSYCYVLHPPGPL